jgi:hypothetical protein
MYTSQIRTALQSDDVVARYFDGVFASDKLPIPLPHFPSAVVANVDPAHKAGSHWIAYHFDGGQHLDYFDSYGHPPQFYNDDLGEFATMNSTTVSYNDRQVQGFDTDVCGQYCILFLALRARGYSLQGIRDYYSWNGRGKPGDRDDEVARDVSILYGMNIVKDNARRQRGSGGDQCEQCCCTRAQCYHRLSIHHQQHHQ